jgi:hypothetical protein
MDANVLIVGADPTGLMLACELGLAGVPATVLERAAEPVDLPKANQSGRCGVAAGDRREQPAGRELPVRPAAPRRRRGAHFLRGRFGVERRTPRRREPGLEARHGPRHGSTRAAQQLPPDENAAAVRDLLTELLRSPEALRRVAEILEGAAPDWAPNMAMTEQITNSIAAAMRCGRALLIDGSDDHVFTSVARPWSAC